VSIVGSVTARAPLLVDDPGTRTSGWRSPAAAPDGAVESAQLSPDGFPLWLVAGTLDAGAALRFGADHGDEVVYVLDGSVDVDGHTCPAGGAVIVESGIAATLAATTRAEVLHFGPAAPEPAPGDGDTGNTEDGAAPRGETVHVVGPGGTWACVEGTRDTRYFADSTCRTCRATLLFTGRSTAYESPAHSHSQDELIHVLSGELHLGATRAGPGSTLAIARDVRYRFRSPGFAFLNYRRGPSYQTLERDRPPILEGGEVHGFTPVMDLR
jgi:hypothetical protein